LAANRTIASIACDRESRYLLGVFSEGDHSMWAIDHPSMILIILAGINLGLKAAFDVDLVERYLGDYSHITYEIVGLAALWQLTRQRFPI
jgi:uncharacterized membrane protein YuzA (DUF378 family)